MSRECCATGLCALHLAHGDCSKLPLAPDAGVWVEQRNYGAQERVGEYLRWWLALVEDRA